MKRIKDENPGVTHKEAFALASQRVSMNTVPPIITVIDPYTTLQEGQEAMTTTDFDGQQQLEAENHVAVVGPKVGASSSSIPITMSPSAALKRSMLKQQPKNELLDVLTTTTTGEEQQPLPLAQQHSLTRFSPSGLEFTPFDELVSRSRGGGSVKQNQDQSMNVGNSEGQANPTD